MPNESLRTPLYSHHVDLKARMVPFAGYEMPVQYSGVLEETKAVRQAAGLFDVSHMGQFALRGKDALSALNKLVTNDLEKLQLGQAQYNVLCRPDGGAIDDLVVYRRAEDYIYICVNASNRENDFQWMQSHLPPQLSFEDESEATALIALQGPRSVEILDALGLGAVTAKLPYYWATEGEIGVISAYVSRTGYTGEDGFELYVEAENAGALWEQILDVGMDKGCIPCGLGSRDTLRTEMGYPLYGHELTLNSSPIAAGLKWVVKLKKNEFIGKEALQKEVEMGSPRQLKAMLLTDRRMARPGYPILSEGKVVGEVTSGVFSPHLDAPIALGFVEKAAATAPTFDIEVRGAAVPAKVVPLPFVQPHTRKF